MKNKKVIVYMSGGLGNQMFQYALGRTLSLKWKIPLLLDISLLQDQSLRPGFTLRQFDLPVFNIQAEIATRKDIPFLFRSYFKGRVMRLVQAIRRKLFHNLGKEKYFHFNPSILNVREAVYFEGYWQSPKYFAGFENVIRKDFTLKKPLSPLSNKLYMEIRGIEAVCVFVRRLDYVGNKLHDTVTKEFYDNALAILLQKISIDRLYIFSDDIEWCQKNMNFTLPLMFVGNEYAGEKYEEKLILMSACKYFIIPNSSFAWWGAWLSDSTNKIVIAPKKWFNDPTINTNDITPSSWIRI